MTCLWRIGGLSALFAVLAAASGCGTTRLEARPNIPQPVITRIPVAVGLYMPVEFSTYLYKGDRYGLKWEVLLGPAQSEGLTRLLGAMFERVVPVDNLANAQQLDAGIRATLEPALEEFSFVTPRDAGTPFYAVSLKYRVSVYTPDGRLAESWPFTGYGIVPSSGMSADKPMARATEMAMRDAGAKLVVEFRDQQIIRALLPDAPRPDTLATPPTQSAPAAAQEPTPVGDTTPPPKEERPSAPAAPPATTEPPTFSVEF